VKFIFIAKHRGIWPVGWLCEALGVSRGGFYAWLTRPRSQRSRRDEELGAKVRASFVASDRTYGARRVWKDMLAEGLSCGLHRIERLMRCRLLKHARTCSTAPSRRLLPTANGLPTSRMCGQRKVGSMWLLLSIFSPGALSAGR
jgi:putative transposase